MDSEHYRRVAFQTMSLAYGYGFLRDGIDMTDEDIMAFNDYLGTVIETEVSYALAKQQRHSEFMKKVSTYDRKIKASDLTQATWS